MKKTRVSQIIILFIFLSNFIYSTDLPPVSVSFLKWDLGKITTNMLIMKKLKIRNNLDKKEYFTISSSCPCIKISENNFSLNPNEIKEIRLEYDSTGDHEGLIEKSLYIINKNFDKVEIEITGEIISGNKGINKIILKADKSDFGKKENIIKYLKNIYKNNFHIIIFASSTCTLCKKIKEKFIPDWRKRSGVNITYSVLNTDEEKFLALLLLLEKTSNYKNMSLPVIIIGDKIIAGMNNIKNNSFEQIIKYENINTFKKLEKNILSKIKKKDIEKFFIKKDKTDIIEKRGLLTGFLMVLLAGLLDGINPCAFAVIILFISYLSILKRKKKEIIYVGIAYSFGIFVTYFLLGLGLLQFFTKMNSYSIFKTIVVIITASFAFLLGVISFIDAIKAKKGDIQDISLKLPKFLKRRIQNEMRERTKSSRYILSSFILGFFVSVFELACSGQVYFPTIVMLSNYNFKKYIFLFIYNLFFLVPLIIIFILFYLGTTSEKLNKTLLKNLSLIKIFLGIFFIGISIFMIYYYLL